LFDSRLFDVDQPASILVHAVRVLGFLDIDQAGGG
jgi:hypothetical protein